jgi:hypothetical protein
MRALAVEAVSVAGPQYASLAIDGQFEKAGYNDPAFLALMSEVDLPRIGAGLVGFGQDLQLAPHQAGSYLT